MKKFMLTMFLLSISSHALASRIWLCNSRNGIDVFRIDTNWPLNTAQRIIGGKTLGMREKLR